MVVKVILVGIRGQSQNQPPLGIDFILVVSGVDNDNESRKTISEQERRDRNLVQQCAGLMKTCEGSQRNDGILENPRPRGRQSSAKFSDLIWTLCAEMIDRAARAEFRKLIIRA
jgi:hypothetical protein